MKILQRQTLVNGKEESMSSQADFLASLSPLQVRERERMITVTSGQKCYEQYAKSDPLGLLVKTLLESSQWFSPARRLKWEAKPLFSEKITEKEYCYDKSMSSKPSVKTLNEKDIPSNRCLFRLVPSERPTEETECGLLLTGMMLPTPTSIDAGTGRINKSRSPNAKERPTIALAAKMGLLPTPNAREADKYAKKYNPNSQMGTTLTAMAVNGMLPTPRANKVNGIDLNNPKIAQRNKGNLEEAVAKIIQNTPLEGGKTSQLNPLFVEEMMGFPCMTTVFPYLKKEIKWIEII
jgi:hypothetical protein